MMEYYLSYNTLDHVLDGSWNTETTYSMPSTAERMSRTLVQVTKEERDRVLAMIKPIFNIETQQFEDTLDEFSIAQTSVISRIKREFKIDALLPVLYNTYLFNGGIDSALRIDGATRLAEKLNLTNVTITDADNHPHEMSLSQADELIIAIASTFQTKFMRKQIVIVQAQNATTITQLEGLEY